MSERERLLAFAVIRRSQFVISTICLYRLARLLNGIPVTKTMHKTFQTGNWLGSSCSPAPSLIRQVYHWLFASHFFTHHTNANTVCCLTKLSTKLCPVCVCVCVCKTEKRPKNWKRQNGVDEGPKRKK